MGTSYQSHNYTRYPLRLFTIFLVVLMWSIASHDLQARPLHTLDFSESNTSQTIEELGVKVTIQTLPTDEDLLSTGLAVIQYPGLPLKMVDLGETNIVSEYQVGIGRIASSDEFPSVIIKSYTGGAHCCYATKIVQVHGSEVRAINFGQFDAAADFEEFPTDVDGDGVGDFILADDSFHYQFTNYASSWAPPMILNVYKGSVVNVSNQPAFHPLFREFSRRAKDACATTNDSFRNGACAAYVAAEARLGNAQRAMTFASEHAYSGQGVQYPSECTADLINYRCPPGHLISFTSFYTAINWFLRRHGYLE